MTLNLSSRLFQASSSTLAPLGERKPVRGVSLAPDQSVIEASEITLPEVSAETAFVLQWWNGEEKLGTTLVRGFPASLLEQLPRLNSGRPVGLFDPSHKLNVSNPTIIQRLENADEFASYEGALLLVAPLADGEHVMGLSSAVRKMTDKGGSVVWMQRASPRQLEGMPSAYVVSTGEGRVVVALTSDLADFAQSPANQLSLIHWAELAVGQRKLELPKDPDP